MPYCPYRNMNIPPLSAPIRPRPQQLPQTHVPLCRDLLQRLIKAMTDEQNAHFFYLELANMTNDSEDKRLILGFARDEMKHFNNFKRLYHQLTGQNPNLPQPEKPAIKSFVDGVKKSIIDETDAFEFYRDTYLCTDRMLVKNILFEAFTDENEHAIRLNYIFTKSKR